MRIANTKSAFGTFALVNNGAKSYNQFVMESTRKRFYTNLIPAVLAYTLAGTYVIVDGWFVGNACGDYGLSALNIAWPVLCVLQSLGTGIGTGGAVLYNIQSSSGNHDKAVEYLRATFTYLLIASVIVIMAIFFNLEWILRLLGASGKTLELGLIYSKIVLLGGFSQFIATGIVPIIRNNGDAKYAMLVMVSGFGFNIVFDWLLIWEFGMGVAGAAYATIGGQLLTAIGGIAYLIRRKIPVFRFSFRLKQVVRISQLGISSFGLSICPSISLLLMNRYFAVLGGAEALAAYAVISYVISISYSLLQGVAEGTQPLISESYSREDARALSTYRKRTYIAGELSALLSVLLLFCIRKNLGSLFGTSVSAGNLVSEKIWIMLLGMFFLCFTKIATAGFYAVERALSAMIMAYAEPVLVFLILLVLPGFLGVDGVWYAEAGAQVLNAILGVILMCRQRK